MSKITCLIGSIGAAMFVIFSLIGCDKTEFAIVVEAPTSVYEDYPTDGKPTSNVIAVLDKEEVAEVINTRYAKDAQYLKIRLKDGRTGYVGWDGKYSIVSKTKNDS